MIPRENWIPREPGFSRVKKKRSFEKILLSNILFVRRARPRAPAEKDFCTRVFSKACWTLKDRGVPSGTANFPSGRMHNFPAGKLCFPRGNYTSRGIMPSGFSPQNYASRGKIMIPREIFSNNYTTKKTWTPPESKTRDPPEPKTRDPSIVFFYIRPSIVFFDIYCTHLGSHKHRNKD